MTDCNRYRQALLAEPDTADPAVLAHLAGCDECGGYAARLRRFESRMRRALQVDMGARGVGRDNRRRWALAASLFVAVGVAGGLWALLPGRSLAADVVAHMAEEPAAWKRTTVPVSSATLVRVLERSQARLSASAGLVSYANSCRFRGHLVPHLVVQTDQGPVTVMLLAHEVVSHAVRFDEHGYRGLIVPLQDHGSLAVLEHREQSGAELAAIVAQVRGALDWSS